MEIKNTLTTENDNIKTLFVNLNKLDKELKWKGKIPDYFLSGCNFINIIFLNGTDITSIGNGFLYDCSSLTSLDTSVFTNVTGIGDFFLWNCNKKKINSTKKNIKLNKKMDKDKIKYTIQ